MQCLVGGADDDIVPEIDSRCLLMAPIILLRLPAAAWLIHVRIGRQAIGARQGGARISGKRGVRISGTDTGLGRALSMAIVVIGLVRDGCMPVESA